MQFRRKLFAGILLAAVTTLPLAKAANEATDVPAGHWAKEDVKTLVDKGYMSLYEDGGFKGDAPLTRYGFVMAMSRLLEELAKLEKNQGGAGGSSKEMGELRGLLDQVKNALGDLDKAQKDIGTKGEKTGETQEVLERDLTKLMDQTAQKMKALNRTMDDLSNNMKDGDRRLAAELAAMNERMREANKKNSQARTMLWIGILAAAAVGASGGN